MWRRWRDRSTARAEAFAGSRAAVVVWSVVVALGTAALVARMVPVGPELLGGAGAVTVATAYTVALAARGGGRPVVFGALALTLGVAVLVVDRDALRSGAAVLTCSVSAVLAVMVTVPAVRFWQAARECTVAVLVAAVGALATVGFEPALTLARFEHVTLALSLGWALVTVHQLGAGLHGLGRRGLIAVVVGSLALAVIVAYAELLRRYGTPGLTGRLFDGVVWSRENLGAFPRPIEALVGVPALAWGCHMRARRRQGWWVCAFGVAAATPVANALVNPGITRVEAALSVGYGLVVGLFIGYLLIRLDLAVSGSRGRRSRRAEEAAAVRPEPPRHHALA